MTPQLTVGELREILSKYPDDMPVNTYLAFRAEDFDQAPLRESHIDTDEGVLVIGRTS